MTQQNTACKEEGMTIFGKSPSEILDTFYNLGLAAKGFSISGRIVPQAACVVGADGQNANLFNGEKLYAGTFTRPCNS